MIKTRILSIDAIPDDCGWQWNAWFTIEDEVFFDGWDRLKPRPLLRYLRDIGTLTDYSKGRLSIEDDGYNVVICLKSNAKPLIAVCYGEYWEHNGL
jgi:hypothetical protein